MKELALNSLMWTFYTHRPMRIGELQEAVALTKDETCQKQTDLVVDEVAVILEACGNLLVVENDIIRPAHYSAQEFFIKPSSGLPQRRMQEIIADAESVHTKLASVCLRYIQLGMLTKPCSDDIKLFRCIQEIPLVWYAAQNFDYHLWRCKILPTNILQLVESLLQLDKYVVAAILQIRKVQDASSLSKVYKDFDYYPNVSAKEIIYETYLYEIDHIRMRWLGDTPIKYALHNAAASGFVNAVERLIEEGYDINEIHHKKFHSAIPCVTPRLHRCRRTAAEQRC